LEGGRSGAEGAEKTSTYDAGEIAPSVCASVSTLEDAELAAIIAAWPTLPAAMRTGVVAMVKAAQP
jgi:hypothetical protein